MQFANPQTQPGSPGPRPPAFSAQGLNNNPSAQSKGHGIMNYSNQCHFMKVAGDDGNPTNGPELVDVDANPGARGFSPSEAPTALPTRERSHTGPYLPAHGLVPPSFSAYGAPADMDTGGSTNDLSGTSPDCQSNRPTPNSSTTGASSSDHQQRQSLAAPGGGLVNGGGGGSGRNSFETSPVPSHQNLGSLSGTTPSDVDRGTVNPYFADPSPFGGLATGLTPDPHQRFGMPGAGGDASGVAGRGGGGEFTGHAATWADMAGPQGMTPGSEGMLRSIILGSMEGMDMAWDAGA